MAFLCFPNTKKANLFATFFGKIAQKKTKKLDIVKHNFLKT